MEKTVNRLLILAFAGTILFGLLTYRYRNAEHDSLIEEEYDIDLCQYIEIDVSRLPVRVVPYDGDTIRAGYKNNKPISFELGDNRLTVKESSKLVISLFTGDESDFGLYMYLPEHTYREIEIDTGMGDIFIGRLDAQSVTASSDGGDIICTDAVSRLSLTTNKGNITADLAAVVDGSEINSRSGNAELIVPPDSAFGVEFDTKTGMCECDIRGYAPTGTYTYTFNGGGRTIGAYIEKGILTIKEKGRSV